MPAVRFEVDNYQVTLGSDLPSIVTDIDAKIVGIIGCYGREHQFIVNFVEEGSSLPKPHYDEGRKTATIYQPISRMPVYVDLLRNEKPIHAYCSSENPHWMSLSTSHEAIGESERKR